jgi:hypothetical protein
MNVKTKKRLDCNVEIRSSQQKKNKERKIGEKVIKFLISVEQYSSLAQLLSNVIEEHCA